ncbi:hypothetical protein ACQY0O_002014 [Thecaphora frezii]
MPLHITHHIRPITLRFTEPGVPDLQLQLSTSSHLHSPPPIPDQLLFDVLVESSHHLDSHSRPSAATAARATTASTAPSDETLEAAIRPILDRQPLQTVRHLKQRIRSSRPALNHRRLRLIYSGRILRDAIRLVPYLDSLDTHRKASLRSLGSLAFDRDDDENSIDEAHDSTDAANANRGKETPSAKWEQVTLRDLLADETEAIAEGISEKAKGKARAREDDVDGLADVKLWVAKKVKEHVYIQCSVGDVMDAEEEERERGVVPPAQRPQPEEATAQPRNPFALTSDSDDDAAEGPDSVPPASSAVQGFDRLLSTGLSPEEVASIRTHFHRSSGLSAARSGDLLRQQEEEEHARALEDAWFDSFSQDADPAILMGGETNGSGTFQTVLEGIMLGFFVPLVPLFLFREGAWPSAFRAESATGRRTTVAEEEEEEEQERVYASARNVTFSKGMQVAVVCGLFANLIMGGFRMLW